LTGGHAGYLKKRVFKIQAGFLLHEGPGSSREMPLDLPQRVEIDDDTYLESVFGKRILTRTKEGILVQGKLRLAQPRECDRCLEGFLHSFTIDIAELFAAPPPMGKSVFTVDSNGEIDLAPLLREETLIEASYRAFCQADCRGLSADTGANLNEIDELPSPVMASGDSSPAIDPRLAVLKELLK